MPTHEFFVSRPKPAYLRGLGTIATDARRDDHVEVVRLPVARSTAAVRFPGPVEIRTLDANGRFRPALAGGDVHEVLGWVPGGVEVAMVDGWMVLTQPVAVRDRPRDRNGRLARFHIDAAGRERVSLRPAHLTQLEATADRHVLVTAVPGAGALVVTAPANCAQGAPNHVRSLITPAP
jgi:hypothetical protein